MRSEGQMLAATRRSRQEDCCFACSCGPGGEDKMGGSEPPLSAQSCNLIVATEAGAKLSPGGPVARARLGLAAKAASNCHSAVPDSLIQRARETSVLVPPRPPLSPTCRNSQLPYLSVF
ncbi:hypothetical protein AAFF_G00423530 [Aldrovandia affinis]|uniref:Uncharacterized protein n=1 Tax=Aldrovandia affinis TaxID=143900 RepID=A0AAD7T728_9TELE|nr:hypothetical protein AAFF_G00423530 [Aldrovandia affinis]